MPTASFYHKTPPVIAGGVAIVCIHAAETSPGSTVILDDELGGDSHNVFATEGATPEEQALAGTRALVIDIGGRMGVSLAPADVTQISPPS